MFASKMPSAKQSNKSMAGKAHKAKSSKSKDQDLRSIFNTVAKAPGSNPDEPDRKQFLRQFASQLSVYSMSGFVRPLVFAIRTCYANRVAAAVAPIVPDHIERHRRHTNQERCP